MVMPPGQPMSCLHALLRLPPPPLNIMFVQFICFTAVFQYECLLCRRLIKSLKSEQFSERQLIMAELALCPHPRCFTAGSQLMLRRGIGIGYRISCLIGCEGYESLDPTFQLHKLDVFMLSFLLFFIMSANSPFSVHDSLFLALVSNIIAIK